MDELYQNLVRLSPKEQVPFRCIGCGACCKHVHMQVPVETLDAFRIVKHLQQQGEDIACMDDFWIRYTEPALLNECGFFVYFLKTQGPEEACIFLQDNRCRIHTVNPRACRIYPLVVDPMENGSSTEALHLQSVYGKSFPYSSCYKLQITLLLRRSDKESHYRDTSVRAILSLADKPHSSVRLY